MVTTIKTDDRSPSGHGRDAGGAGPCRSGRSDAALVHVGGRRVPDRRTCEGNRQPWPRLPGGRRAAALRRRHRLSGGGYCRAGVTSGTRCCWRSSPSLGPNNGWRGKWSCWSGTWPRRVADRCRRDTSATRAGWALDIWFRLDLPPLPREKRNEIPQLPMVDPETGRPDPDRWGIQHAELIRAAALNPRVSRVFVGAAIKRDVCERGWTDRRWRRAGCDPGPDTTTTCTCGWRARRTHTPASTSHRRCPMVRGATRPTWRQPSPTSAPGSGDRHPFPTGTCRPPATGYWPTAADIHQGLPEVRGPAAALGWNQMTGMMLTVAVAVATAFSAFQPVRHTTPSSINANISMPIWMPGSGGCRRPR